MYYEEKKKNKEKLILYCSIVVIITLLLVLVLKTEVPNSSRTSNYVAERLDMNIEDDPKYENNNKYSNVSKIIEKSVNSVVGISKLKQTGSSIFINNAEEKLGLGSGVVITDDGYILTNQHVAGNKYSSCYVTISDGTVCEGSVVWADENIDLAIVKINKSQLDFLELGDSDNITIAEEVYAIGNPLGMEFQNTVTKGIISSTHRTIKIENDEKNVYMEDLIQTDSTINEGNSGGALINSEGKLIGINTVKISNAEGIGFAVPVNIVKPIVNKLVNNGKFEEAWIGLYGYDKEAIKYLNSNLQIESGIYVAQIATDGPIHKSDLQEGDIITQIDGIKINKMNDLKKYIYSKFPGDRVTLEVDRNGKKFDLEVILSSKF